MASLTTWIKPDICEGAVPRTSSRDSMTSSPKNSKRLILMLVGFPLALAGGYGVGLMRKKDGIFSGNSAPSSQKTAAESAAAAGSAKSKAAKKKDSAATAFDSQRGWIDRIGKADVSEFGDMWKEIMGDFRSVSAAGAAGIAVYEMGHAGSGGLYVIPRESGSRAERTGDDRMAETRCGRRVCMGAGGGG